VDLFVSEALAAGQALGGILVVQTTSSPASTARTAALATGAGYPVRIRGLERSQPVDRTVHCRAVVGAVHADSEWARVCEAIVSPIQVIVSNTADKGLPARRRGQRRAASGRHPRAAQLSREAVGTAA
jgi:tagaturonate reductase